MPRVRKAALCMAGLCEYEIPPPSRNTFCELSFRSGRTSACRARSPARGLEVRGALPVREVEEKADLRWVDAGGERGPARVADRTRREPHVLACVVRRVEDELRRRRLWRQPAQRVKQRRVDA